MYKEHFGLRHRPFDLTPDPSLLYLNAAYNEALAVLRYGVSARKGFVSLVGEAGTGKTTVLRRFVSDLGESAKSVFVFNPSVGFEEMLAFVLDELAVEVPKGASKLELLQALNQFLLAELRNGGNVVILIDEAQDLGADVMEELRLLSNLETDKEKILQIVFSGQPEFEEKLADPSLRQLRQRIGLRAKLPPLSRTETSEYIRARLQAAGAGASSIFTAAAMRSIWRASRGIPRVINVICDGCLVAAYAAGKKRVTSRLVREVISESGERVTGRVEGWRKLTWGKEIVAAGVVGAAAAIALALWLVPVDLELERVVHRAEGWVQDIAVPTGLWADPGKEAGFEHYLPARRGEVKTAEDPNGDGLLAAKVPSSVEPPEAPKMAGAVPVQTGESVGPGEKGAQDNEPLDVARDETQEVASPQQSGGGSEEEKVPRAGIEEAVESRQGVEHARVGTQSREERAASSSTSQDAMRSVEPPAAGERESVGALVPVRPGDTLTELAARRYGRVSFTLLDAIKSANPSIGDIDLIWAGQNLVLPPIDGALRVRQEEDGGYTAWVISAGSFQSAQDYVTRLAEMGFAGRISLVSTDAGPRTRFVRIWVGGFDSAEEAGRTARRLRAALEGEEGSSSGAPQVSHGEMGE